MNAHPTITTTMQAPSYDAQSEILKMNAHLSFCFKQPVLFFFRIIGWMRGWWLPSDSLDPASLLSLGMRVGGRALCSATAAPESLLRSQIFLPGFANCLLLLARLSLLPAWPDLIVLRLAWHRNPSTRSSPLL